MKKAEFTYKGNPTGRKEETVHAVVILKDDGKISTSGLKHTNNSHQSYAAYYAANKLAAAIVESNFCHPAITRLIESDSNKGLVASLFKETADLDNHY